LEISFEPASIELEIDGKRTLYIPDFYIPSEDRYVEIKGLRRDVGMRKLAAAQDAGLTISLVLKKDLENWCGTKISSMDRAFAEGGPEAVRSLLSA